MADWCIVQLATLHFPPVLNTILLQLLLAGSSLAQFANGRSK